MEGFASQVQVAMRQAHVFRIIGLTEYRQRQFSGRRLDFHLTGDDLDRSSVEIVVHQRRVASNHLALNGENALGSKTLNRFESWRAGIENDLRQAVVVSKINEDDATMIAPTVQPAGQFDSFADMGWAKLAASMGAVCVHGVGTPNR